MPHTLQTAAPEPQEFKKDTRRRAQPQRRTRHVVPDGQRMFADTVQRGIAPVTPLIPVEEFDISGL